MKTDWGETDGQRAGLRLPMQKVLEVKISTYGGIVTSFISADKSGGKSNIGVR